MPPEIASVMKILLLSAVAVFGGTRVAVGLPLMEADPPHMVLRQAAARRR
jgi:hypothetical protein